MVFNKQQKHQWQLKSTYKAHNMCDFNNTLKNKTNKNTKQLGQHYYTSKTAILMLSNSTELAVNKLNIFSLQLFKLSVVQIIPPVQTWQRRTYPWCTHAPCRPSTLPELPQTTWVSWTSTYDASHLQHGLKYVSLTVFGKHMGMVAVIMSV